MVAGDETVVSFPTYADLTQTQGWSRDATAQVSIDVPVELSPHDARYAEGAVLGVGGMGKVLLAHDARIGRDVAVKQLHTDRELAPEDRARFLREARVQGQLEHPSIVPVYDIDQRPDGTTFFTMRRVLGRTLAAILDELRAGDRRSSQRELLTAFATVCLAIDYAHSRGVIHRDLKPANIMLGDFGEVYVLDWGLARLVDEEPAAAGAAAAGAPPAPRLSMPGEMMGTPLYMAPEQMTDPGVGPAADVFALGAILFELLTLQRLRDARTLYLPAEARPSVRAPDRGVAPELETICVRATQTDPAARYPSARALHDALIRYLDGDRELEQRRELAAAHAGRAREALARAEASPPDAERERGTAMRELVRALALDPTDDTNVATFGQVMATPPRTPPPEVIATLRADEQQLVRIGARYSAGAMLAWFAFLPVVYAMGLRSPSQAALVLIPAGLCVALAAAASRFREIGTWVQLTVIGLTIVAAIGVSRMYGPLVLVPTLIATFTIVVQAHPSRVIRWYTVSLGALAIGVPPLLELAGVIPASYVFEGGRMAVLPQMHELPATASYLTLTIASMLMISVPCLFVARLRVALNDAQTRLSVQAWHFRRLGDQLTRA